MSTPSIKQPEKFSEISDESMNTIKNIISCLPKSSYSRNNRNTFIFKGESNSNAPPSNKNIKFRDNNMGKNRTNKFYMDSYSNTSSCSSNNSQMDNISNLLGNQNLNYSKVASKSKFIYITIYSTWKRT